MVAKAQSQPANVHIPKSDNMQFNESHRLQLFRKQELCGRLAYLRKQPRLSWVMDLKNFSFKFLTLQGVITPIFSMIVYLNPMAGLIGVAINIIAGLLYGIYFTIKERDQRNFQDKMRIVKINTLLKKETFMDYLFSDEFEYVAQKLCQLDDATLVKLNKKLRRIDFFKDNLNNLHDIDDVRKRMIKAYIKKIPSTYQSEIIDKCYTHRVKQAHNTISYISIGPTYATLISGILYSSVTIGGLVLSATLIGGFSVASIALSLGIATLVALLVCYAQVKRSKCHHQYITIIRHLENQHAAIKYIKNEIECIQQEIHHLEKKNKSNTNDVHFDNVFSLPNKKTAVASQPENSYEFQQNNNVNNFHIFTG